MMRSIRWATILLLGGLLAAGAALGEGKTLRLRVGSFDPLAAEPPLPGGLRLKAEPEEGLFVAQFHAAPSAELLRRLRGLGAEPLEYLPDDGYLLRLDRGASASVRGLGEVRWLGAVQPGWKISPDLGTRPFADAARRASGVMRVTADLARGSDATAAASAAVAAGAELVQIVRFGHESRLRLRATRRQVEAVARLADVTWIEEEAEITPRNDTTSWVLQSFVIDSRPVWDHGLHGEGQIFGLIDEPMDMGSCFFRDETNNTPGPGHRKVVAYRSSSGLGSADHGTHTAGTLAGDRLPIGGTLEWGGMAPAGKISFGSLWDITGGSGGASNVYQALADAHADGARIHSNSWGDDGTNEYTAWSRDLDAFMYDFEDSLVVQAGTNLSSGRSPENSKSPVAVSAAQQGSAAISRCHGSIGPTIDGRRKPEVLGPGCDIISARPLFPCSTVIMTGTSMATPGIAGVTGLMRQYYTEGWYPSGVASAPDALVPSGALMRATLLNATVDMTGDPGYPTDEEGWGRPLLENALYFAGDARRLSVIDDRRNADGLSTGEAASFVQNVLGSGEQLKVTLAFTEPPAALLAAEATVNDLDLEVVSPSGALYRGNVIDTATGLSVTGGSADPRNTLEMVIVDAPEPGGWTVRVLGAAVNQGTQGFALVASGDVEPFVPYPLEHVGSTIQDSAPLGNQDGVIDPGETVVMPETLRNAGGELVTGVSGSLSVSEPGLVKVTRSAATYPDIPAGAQRGTDSPHYRFTVSPDTPCGTRLRFDIALGSSAGEGSVSFSHDVGCQPLDCGGIPAPASEVAGLLLSRSGASDLRLSWDALAGAAGYRVWNSAGAGFVPETLVGTSTTTELIEAGGATGSASWFYLVRATNECEWEGP